MNWLHDFQISLLVMLHERFSSFSVHSFIFFYNNNFLWGIILRLNWSLIPLDDVVSIVSTFVVVAIIAIHCMVWNLVLNLKAIAIRFEKMTKRKL